jgi:hypothetical protein
MVRCPGAFVHRQHGTTTVTQFLGLCLVAVPVLVVVVAVTPFFRGHGSVGMLVLAMVFTGGQVVVFWCLREGMLDEFGNPIPGGVVVAVDDRGVLVGALLGRRPRLVRWPDVAGLCMISESTGLDEAGTREEFDSFLLVTRQNPWGRYRVSLQDMGDSDISWLESAVGRFASDGLVLTDERVSTDWISG